MSVKVVTLDALPGALKSLLQNTAKKNQELVARKFADAPIRFKRAALAFYGTVLRVRHGFLRNAIEEFGRMIGTGKWEVGLGDRMEYALIQHEGGFIPPHVIEPRFKAALFWPGAAHPCKRVNHPGSRIPATHFLSIPMVNETETIMEELKKEIGFAD